MRMKHGPVQGAGGPKEGRSKRLLLTLSLPLLELWYFFLLCPISPSLPAAFHREFLLYRNSSYLESGDGVIARNSYSFLCELG